MSAHSQAFRTLFERVSGFCDLPPLPAVAARAMALIRDPETEAEDLARLVSTDATIAARVLRLSRSVLYVRRQPPRTLREAIVTVGYGALRKMLLVASARSAYPQQDAVARGLWEHALATALACDELAMVAGEPRGGSSFIAGLMHDIGRLVFHVSDPQGYASLPAWDEDGELARFGVTHAAVGACLAEQWGIETEVVDALMFHHAEETTGLAKRVQTADRIAHEIGYGSTNAVLPRLEDEGIVEVAGRVAATFAAERGLFE